MSDWDGRELLALAEAAAREAGALLLERFAGPRERVHAKSTPTDLVSDADVEAEQAIRALIAARRPRDDVLGEEGGDAGGGDSGLRWVVDPLDGTVNFIFGIPHWSVSVACEDADGALAGVVLDPLRDECFGGCRGGGATLNGRALSGPVDRPLANSMVATGYAYDAAARAQQGRITAELLPRVRDIRRFGSAALDLAWTAAGRYDVYFEHGVKRWDVAAGQLACEQAGLRSRRLRAHGSLPEGLLVARAAVLEEVAAIVDC